MKKVTNTQILTAIESTNALIGDLTKSINDLVKNLASTPKTANKGKGKKAPAPASAPAKVKDTRTLEEKMAEWNKKKASYTPSDALKKAIKKDRCKITHAVARDKYGFVGTKKDLDTLKAEICK
jgi:hypothetical protein